MSRFTIRFLSLNTLSDSNACYVYVIGTYGEKQYKTYVGWTTDLDRRLFMHNNGGGAKSTRGRQWILLYAEKYLDRRDAMRREWHLKKDRLFRKKIKSIT